MSGKKKETPEPQELPEMEGAGVGRVKIAEIDRLARKYNKLKEERCAITPSECAAKQELIEAIDRHADEIGKDAEGVVRYYAGDWRIELTPGKRTLRVSTSDDGGEEEE